MPIDECVHDFSTLARDIFPAYLQQLRHEMKTPHKAKEFTRKGCGPISMARLLGLDADFSGCYVLLDEGIPIYVGISRSVLARLRQHVTGKSHFDASLVYAIAQRRCPTPGQRSNVMLDQVFAGEFRRAQKYLQGLDVSFLRIDNPLELYLFEAYAAMEFDTSVWNTFRTH